MSKRRKKTEYIPNKVTLEHSIRNNFENLEMKPNEKTFYIFDTLYRLIKSNKEQHIFVLELLKELNEQAVYQVEEDREDMLNRLNKALQEMKS